MSDPEAECSIPPIPCSRRGFEFTSGSYFPCRRVDNWGIEYATNKVEIVTYTSDWEHSGPKGLVSPSRLLQREAEAAETIGLASCGIRTLRTFKKRVHNSGANTHNEHEATGII